MMANGMKRAGNKKRKARHTAGGNMETRISTSSPVSTRDSMHPLTIIECEKCKSLGYSCLAYAEAEALICDGTVSRYCRTCRKNTMWRRLDIPARQSSFNVAWSFQNFAGPLIYWKGGENPMYELTEYGLVILGAVIAGGLSFVAAATVLAVMEAVNATQRRLRTR
jgi:hypothetical protein